MEIHILSTGSKGNCAIIEDNGSKLMIDCGIKLDSIITSEHFGCFKDYDYLLVTHEHKDHSLAQKELKMCGMNIIDINTISNKPFKTENWLIKPFEVKHSIKCQGFLIKALKSNKTIYWATDFYYTPYILNCDIYCIEVNYDFATLDYQIAHGEAIRSNFSAHNSLENAVEFMSQLPKKPELIVTLHKSSRNLNQENVLYSLKPYANRVVIANKNVNIHI